MATATRAITVESLIAKHAADIAFAAEAQAATTPDGFVVQLRTASHNLGHFAGINGAEDLERAADYLGDAIDADSDERTVLLKKASKYLRNTDDMVDEYRDMV